MDIDRIQSDLVEMEMELNQHEKESPCHTFTADKVIRKIMDKTSPKTPRYVSLAVLERASPSNNSQVCHGETIYDVNKSIENITCKSRLDTGGIDDFIMNTSVKVTIKGKGMKDFEFELPGHSVVAREKEMKYIARSLRAYDWSESLLMEKIKEKHMSNTIDNDKDKQVSIILGTDEEDIDFTSITFSSTLKKIINRFYVDGVISVCNDDTCTRHDLIHLLNALRIPYADDHKVFKSFGSYLNFKLWSDYFSCRKMILNWIKRRLLSQNLKNRYIHYVVFHPEIVSDSLFYFQGQKCEQFDGGLASCCLGNTDDNDHKPSNTVRAVYDLFDGNQTTLEVEGEIPVKMNRTHNRIREDLRVYLKYKLPDLVVSFSLERVILHSESESFSINQSLIRPVLSIDIGESNREYPNIPLISLTEEGPFSECEPRQRSYKTVDSMNAEWLVNVFLCKTNVGLSLDRYD